MIEKYQTHYCAPNPSKESTVYTFKRNIRPNELIEKLKKIGYEGKFQISNYQAKCVGLYTYANGDTEQSGVFVPCFPWLSEKYETSMGIMCLLTKHTFCF
jgi:hypothetical protein